MNSTQFENKTREIIVNESQIVSSSNKGIYFGHCAMFNNKNYWQPDDLDKEPFLQYNFENLYIIPIMDIVASMKNDDSHSSWSMTDKEINPTLVQRSQWADLNQQRIQFAPADLHSSGSMTDKEMNMSLWERIQISSGLNIYRFKITYFTKENKWIDYPIELEGIHENNIKRYYLEKPIECCKLRIYPLSHTGNIALKVKLHCINYKRHNIFHTMLSNPELNNHYYKTPFVEYNNIDDLVTSSCEPLLKMDIHEHEKTLLGEPVEEGICLFTYVMNRTDNIKKNISSWLNQKIDQLLIIDWSSQEDFYEFIDELQDSRIQYVRITNESTFLRTYAQNLAAKMCKYDKICKIDSDIVLYDNFFENHPLTYDSFYVGEWMCARNDNEKSTHGNIYLNLKDYLYVNGYNEYIKGYGWDDSDFTIRLMLSGLEKKLFNMNLFYHVPHDKIKRICNLDLFIHPEAQTLAHRLYLKQTVLWNKQFHMAKYKVDKKENNYIICTREKENEYQFNSENYKKCIEEAIVTVFSWFKEKNNAEHKKALKEKNIPYINAFLASL